MPINPKILIKSREYLDLSIEKASDVLKEPKEKINKWEKGEKKPTYNQLLKISKKYNQSINHF